MNSCVSLASLLTYAGAGLGALLLVVVLVVAVYLARRFRVTGFKPTLEFRGPGMPDDKPKRSPIEFAVWILTFAVIALVVRVGRPGRRVVPKVWRSTCLSSCCSWGWWCSCSSCPWKVPEHEGLERLAYLVLGATLPEIGRAVKRIMDGVGGDGS